jgi:mono/diheme cytochrome c family protein
MNRRWLAIVLGALAVLALMLVVTFRGPDGIHDRPPLTPPAGESVARGAYLIRVGNCGGCHTEKGGLPFAGGRAIETPFGTVYAGNLTPHPASGIGGWSREDFWHALHEGRSRAGRLLVPAFPYPDYTHVTRADSDAMFDYLRTLAPVDRPNTPHRLRWPYDTQAALALWRALYFRPEPFEEDRNAGADWNRGAYLVRGLGHCGACHTARNALGASSRMMDLSGGLIPMQNWYAPSLTSSVEAGVAAWDVERIERLLRTGVTRGAMVSGPMAEVVMQGTQFLTGDDARAMAVFLKSLPQTAADSQEAAPRAPGGRRAERGARLYEHHCAQCHGDDGQGVANAYPALAGNRAVLLPVTANLVQMVLYGGFPPATAGNPRPFGMPPFANELSDADVAAVLNHIRSAWGNRAAGVSELAVSQQRGGSGW